MLPFITKKINNPWGQYELNQWASNGSQRDKVIYNPTINARFIVEDKNTYSACIKVNGGEYKNFWLVPITRTSFLIIAYVPQLEILNELDKIQTVRQILPKFELLYSICNFQNKEEGYKINENIRIGSGAIIMKIDEALDEFIFPWNGQIDNEEIISSYSTLNKLYARIIYQIDKLFHVAEEICKKEIEAIEAKQKQIIKKTVIKTGIKLAAVFIAPYAVAAIEGVDLLVDGLDIMDTGIPDFSISDNLLELGDGIDISDFACADEIDFKNELMGSDDFDNSLNEELYSSETDSYNVSFGKQKETLSSMGNGSTLRAEISKKPGTSNEFIIETKNGTVEVSGSTDRVEIGHIVYKLPKLKG